MIDLETILSNSLHRSSWQIEKSPDGLSKETYIAKHDGLSVFLKLDGNTPVLTRLATLQIAPKVLASGVIDGISFLIQEYFSGVYPDTTWFNDNIEQVATVLKTYHQDTELNQILQRENKVKTIDTWLDEFDNHPDGSVDLLRSKANGLKRMPVQPVHADPNRKNFLVHGAEIRIVDWDDSTLADPLLDTALLAYWYLPQTKWDAFLKSVGIEITADTMERFHWFVAAQSLHVSLWFAKRGNKTEQDKYLEDFTTAIKHRPNPKR